MFLRYVLPPEVKRRIWTEWLLRPGSSEERGERGLKCVQVVAVRPLPDMIRGSLTNNNWDHGYRLELIGDLRSWGASARHARLTCNTACALDRRLDR